MAEASPKTPLRELTALPCPLARFEVKGRHNFKGRGKGREQREEGEGRGGGRGRKCSKKQNQKSAPLVVTAAAAAAAVMIAEESVWTCPLHLWRK